MSAPVRISRDLSFRLVGASLFLLVSYALMLRNVADFDLWGVVSFGALIDQAGFPRFDVFSYTAPNAEWIYHEWGSGVLFFRLLTELGDSALFVVKLALFGAALMTAATVHRAATASYETSLPDGIFFVVGLPGSFLLLNSYIATVRCHAFSVLGYLLFLWILDTYRRRPDTRATWLLPPIMALWVNLHGGFALGLFALAVHFLWLAVERRRQQATELAIVSLLCCFAMLLNPYGWRFVPKIVEAWTMSRAPVGEWGSVIHNGPVFAWTYAGLVVATLAVAAWNVWRTRRFPGVLLLLAGTAIQGWLHVKLVPFFLFTMLALGVAEFAKLIDERQISIRVRDFFDLLLPAGIGAATVTLICLHVATADSPLRPRVAGWDSNASRPADANYYPIGAVEYLRTLPGNVNLWSPFRWGEFVAWTLYPNVRVSMDGRFETLYSESVREDHLRFWGARHDIAAADEYDTTHILIPATDVRLLGALDASSWGRIYEDPVAVVYARDPTGAVSATRPNVGAYVGDYLGDLSRFAARAR